MSCPHTLCVAPPPFYLYPLANLGCLDEATMVVPHCQSKQCLCRYCRRTNSTACNGSVALAVSAAPGDSPVIKHALQKYGRRRSLRGELLACCRTRCVHGAGPGTTTMSLKQHLYRMHTCGRMQHNNGHETAYVSHARALLQACWQLGRA
jgi:hypothetical protein